jgi:hypothetical protein
LEDPTNYLLKLQLLGNAETNEATTLLGHFICKFKSKTGKLVTTAKKLQNSTSQQYHFKIKKR